VAITGNIVGSTIRTENYLISPKHLFGLNSKQLEINCEKRNGSFTSNLSGRTGEEEEEGE
jgi:hypothetical protein